MPTLHGTIDPEGALVTLSIGVSGVRRHRLQRAQMPVPAAVQVRVVLDPGSGVTLADNQALQSLGVTSYANRSLLASASGVALHTLPAYSLSIALLDAAGQTLRYWPRADVL